MDGRLEDFGYVYLVRPKGDLWELSFNSGRENGVLFASQGEAVSQADALARGRWELRGERCSVRVDSSGEASTFRATYGHALDADEGAPSL
jgi:hypothetical protein